MGTETNSSLDTVSEQEILTLLLIILSLHTHQICCAVKYLIFVLPVFNIQEPVHSNRIMSQILKEAFSQHHMIHVVYWPSFINIT